jgi:hypothetical protein
MTRPSPAPADVRSRWKHGPSHRRHPGKKGRSPVAVVTRVLHAKTQVAYREALPPQDDRGCIAPTPRLASPCVHRSKLVAASGAANGRAQPPVAAPGARNLTRLAGQQGPGRGDGMMTSRIKWGAATRQVSRATGRAGRCGGEGWGMDTTHARAPGPLALKANR